MRSRMKFSLTHAGCISSRAGLGTYHWIWEVLHGAWQQHRCLVVTRWPMYPVQARARVIMSQCPVTLVTDKVSRSQSWSPTWTCTRSTGGEVHEAGRSKRVLSKVFQIYTFKSTMMSSTPTPQECSMMVTRMMARIQVGCTDLLATSRPVTLRWRTGVAASRTTLGDDLQQRKGSCLLFYHRPIVV